ncbi:hypothetical protein [Neisseria lactamica]|uniref:hypothetical protein n=1 Tax=Neisseria lactamica TaxID=486 RepID=UPI001EFC8488|nr:hypothetical protein [Neisseria lactamica]
MLVSPFLLGFCGENNVNLAFFAENGHYLGRLQGAAERQCAVESGAGIGCRSKTSCRLRAISLRQRFGRV